MGGAKRKGLLQRLPQTSGIHGPSGRNKSNIGQILDPRVWSQSWHRIRVKFLCDMCLDRIDSERRWLNTSKLENIFGGSDFRLAEDWVAERDVDPERSPIYLSGEATFCAKTKAFVFYPVTLNFGMMIIGSQFKNHKISKFTTCCLLKFCENFSRLAYNPNVNILGRTGAIQAQLEDKPAFQSEGLAQLLDETCQKAVKDQELSPSCQFRPGSRRLSKALF